MTDTNPCSLFECADVACPVDYCERVRQCPYAWARRSREDRTRKSEGNGIPNLNRLK